MNRNQYCQCYNDLVQQEQQHFAFSSSSLKYILGGSRNQQIILRVNFSCCFCKRKLICISAVVVLETVFFKLTMVFTFFVIDHEHTSRDTDQAGSWTPLLPSIDVYNLCVCVCS